MNIDIRTLIIVITISSFLQVIALFLQYRLNKAYLGTGWWLLGFASAAMGYGFLFLRDNISIKLITIIFANALIVLEFIFIYIGIMRFLDKKENRSIVITIFTAFILSFIYYTYFDNNITLRTVIVYSTVAAISLLNAHSLFFNKTRLITAAANFNTVLFLVQFCFFTFRAVVTLTVDPVSGFFTPTLVQTVSFLFLFVQGTLLTFGLIIMVNQRLNRENSEAKENLELIFNTSPDAVLVARWTEDYLLDINEKFTALTGYTPAEVIGKSSQDINIWKNPAERQQLVTALKDKGYCENMEAVFRRKDGSQLTAMISARIITLQGAPHIICVTSDITERKQAYEELRKRENEFKKLSNQLEAILDHIPGIVFYKDKNNNFIRVNKYFAEAQMKNKVDLEGKNLFDLYPQADAEKYYQDDLDVINCGAGKLNIEEHWQAADGDKWVSTSKIPFLDDDGEIIGVIGISMDITERKRADEYREMGREILQILNEPGDLQESIARVLATLKTRTGFDAVGIRLQDGEDFPYFVQQGFSDDFLLTENTLVERAADGGVCRDKDGSASLECTCGLVISGQTDPLNPLFTERGSAWTNDSFPILDIPIGDDPRHNPRNNCIHQGYASIALIPIRNQSRIVGLIQLNDRRKGLFTINAVEALEGIASHIGAALMRKQAEAALRRSEDQNRQLQKSESLGRMAGAIAHHFNNQLGAVIGNLELALLELPKGTRGQESVAKAMKASNTAAQMSGLMLTYLGQSFDKLDLLDISEVCRRDLPLLEGVMPDNIVLKTALASPGPTVNTNTKHIQQVLTNLVTNAQEAIGMNRGSISLTVKTVSCDNIPQNNRFPVEWQPDSDSYACLEVTDTGCGIADKDIEKIFDPFYSSKFTGRGMGLAAVIGIVRVHGGVITVESKTGQGSAFRVFLPLAEQQAALQ